MNRTGQHEDLMTPSEVGQALRVDPKTVSRWSKAGKLDSIRTPGGHRRFRRADIDAIARGEAPKTAQAAA